MKIGRNWPAEFRHCHFVIRGTGAGAARGGGGGTISISEGWGLGFAACAASLLPQGDGAPGCAEATPRLQRVYQSWWYSSLVTLVILSNTTLLTVQSVWALPPPLLTTLDWVFLGIFTAEMLFGIAALGLVRPRGYFRSGWTILDAGVVAAGWVAALSARGSGLSSFRALRILQPMGRVPAMRALVGTLVGSRSPTAVRL